MPLRTIAVLVAALLAATAAASAAAATKMKRHPKRAPRYIMVPPPDPYAVYVAGTYVGSDPDPRIRASLIREFYQRMQNR